MATKRKPLGNAKRFKILQRDGFRCQYCGATPPAVVLHVDHVVAVANGGTNDADNLVTSCSNCNHGKGTKPLSTASPVNYRKIAADTKARAEQLRLYREHLEALQSEIERAIDVVGAAFYGNGLTWDYQRAHTRRLRVAGFLEALGLEFVVETARLAAMKIPRDEDARFTYFSGLCSARRHEVQRA